ncbi:hypothetical protein OG612_43810 (plasmid) [Streptomyces sp. NBC_01527]|uniref:hypothetical protein n=1 Tax=unclassified Streptomyces TaxID=2593676 RepID=UPI002E114E91|nr:hypothetical protein OG763_44410 [Streptomyces sp. NBC_01230]
MTGTAFAQRGTGLPDADQEPEFLESDALDVLGGGGTALAAADVRELGGAQGQQLLTVALVMLVGGVRGQNLRLDPAHRPRPSRGAGTAAAYASCGGSSVFASGR